MFPSNYEKSQRLNGLRQKQVRVPEEILVQLVNKFEEPNEEVYNNVNEVWYIYW